MTHSRLSVHLDADDRHGHRPLYSEIVHRAHAAGLAGASVLQGVEGYGATSRIHTDRLLSLSEALPIIVIIVDDETKLRRFLPTLAELGVDGLVTLEPVEVVDPGDLA